MAKKTKSMQTYNGQNVHYDNQGKAWTMDAGPRGYTKQYIPTEGGDGRERIKQPKRRGMKVSDLF